MRSFSMTIALALATLLFVSISSAQQATTTAIPNLIRYGATLKDASGAPLAATTGVTFAVYKQQDGGAPIWMETQNITTDGSGNYSVLLGSTTATGLPGDLFSQQEQRWLGVQVQGEAEQPRVLLVSVPYAFKAHEAETLGGKSVSDFVLANGANPAANGGDARQASSTANNLSVMTAGIKKDATSDGPTNFSGSTTDQIVKITQGGTGNGLVANANAPSGNTLGVYGQSASPNGIGVYGFNSASTGSTGGIWGSGVAGWSHATSGYANGVYGQTATPNGGGVVGYNTATGGTGVNGFSTSITGSGIGVYGSSASTSGVGVSAIATATTGNTVGVYGTSKSSGGTAGVFNNIAGGKILSGQNIGVEKFSVDGSGHVNSASGTYQIGGSSVLSIGRAADSNLFLGVGAGANNVAGSGQHNLFSGYQAGYSNTTGYYNTFSGDQAGYSNTSGYENYFFGHKAGYSNTTGFRNTFTGGLAGFNNTTGVGNVFSGGAAGYHNTTGSNNTYFGVDAGNTNTTGSKNTFYGYQAGLNNTGEYNTFSGFDAGLNNTTGNNDIYIGNLGCTSPCSESNTIRIGGDTGFGAQTVAYIAGIYGSTSSGGVPVYINSSGQLGTLTSSLRYKEQVRDMGDSTSALMKLRAVTFLYKPEYAKGDRTLQYGLIAEEVAKVYPELVAYDQDGEPYTVRYQYLAPMLLNEVQKQRTVIATQQEVIKTQQEQIQTQGQQIADFQRRLSRIETLIGTQAKSAGAAAPGAGTP